MTAAQESAAYNVELTHTFNAPRDEVFAAWTEAEQLVQWFGSHGSEVTGAAVDLRVGGAWHMDITLIEGEKIKVHGTFREIVVPQRLVYTWFVDGPRVGGIKDTLVTVEFRARGDWTDLSLRHEALPDEPARERHAQGWAGCCQSLEEHLKRG